MSGNLAFNREGVDVRIEIATECIATMVWPASRVLANSLCDGLVPDLKDLRTLELGAGTGLTSAVAAQLGASVLATELPEGLELLSRNLAANAQGRATCESLTWGTRVPDNLRHVFDLILGADITYVEEALRPLVASVLQFASTKTTIVIAQTHRANPSAKECVDKAATLLGHFFDLRQTTACTHDGEEVTLLTGRLKEGSDQSVEQFLHDWFAAGGGDRVYASHSEMIDDVWGSEVVRLGPDEQGPMPEGHAR